MKCGGSGFAIAGKDPLLAMFVLKIADVAATFGAVDDWWVAA